MLLKSTCEKCYKTLQHDSEAYICSYECTYCETCVIELKHICPNCSGELVIRLKREIKEEGK
jgi:hypothetical protein